jgi:hypothetical protein
MAHIVGLLIFAGLATLLVRWLRPVFPYVWRSILGILVGIFCVGLLLFFVGFCATQVVYMKLSPGDMALAVTFFALGLVMLGVGILRTSYRVLLLMETASPEGRQRQIRLYSAAGRSPPDEPFFPN